MYLDTFNKERKHTGKEIELACVDMEMRLDILKRFASI